MGTMVLWRFGFYEPKRYGGNMQVGDLVISKNRYVGQFFIVIGYGANNVIQCVRIEDGFKTRWSKASTWEVICK